MSTINLLYRDRYAVNDKIDVIIPTVGQIEENEDQYYSIVSTITSMPIDMIVPLDEAGIDFTEINEWDLFLLLFPGIQSIDTSLVFGDLDMTKFSFAVNEQNGNVVLINKDDDIVIDRALHAKIATVLRRIHRLEKNRRRPANVEAKEYMIERAKAKAKRNKNRSFESQLESLIIAMVNTEQFKYNFEQTRNLTIYQFNESVRQVVRKIDYDNLMHGIYSGTVNVKEINQDSLNWLSHKK